MFLCDHQLYELILTACTPKEELEWRTRLNNQATNIPDQDQMQPATFSSLSLNIKTLGTVFRKPGTIARKMSIHRATTVGPKSPLCQVILKNTSVIKDAPTPSYGSQINRSQSLLTTNARIPVLAPPRGERARLEAMLSDVWTRDVLPFPGITARSRSEHLVRSSASSVMRKLSVVSIASSFTKRSTSLASLQQKSATEDEATILREGVHLTMRVREQSEDASASGLAVIPDEVERRSLLMCSSGHGLGSEVTRRDKTTTGSEEEESRPCTSAIMLQSSVNHSRRPSLQRSNFSEASTRESEKENRYSSPPNSGKASTHSHSSNKLSIKRAWVGALHREAMVQSIRSLFR